MVAGSLFPNDKYFSFLMFYLDKLQSKCVLVPASDGNFLGSENWLVVECDLLQDSVGKWGISPETFYNSQKSFCNSVQGIIFCYYLTLPSPFFFF